MKKLRLTPAEVSALISRAWDWAWTNKYDTDYYLSATDLHRRVRAAAAELLEEKPYGYYGRDVYLSGPPMRLSGLSLADCRSWLSREVRAGRIEADSPSQRGTCTGLRLRPVGAPKSEAELKAATVSPEERSRQKYVRHHEGIDGRPACMANTPKPRSFSCYRRTPYRFSGQRYGTMYQATCKKCLKISLVPIVAEKEEEVEV